MDGSVLPRQADLRSETVHPGPPTSSPHRDHTGIISTTYRNCRFQTLLGISESSVTMQTKKSKERKISDATKRSLASPSFDIWKWNPDEIISLMMDMYEHLDLIDALNINRNTLFKFLTVVRDTYRDNPFHNFRHCFCVTQMMYVLIRGCERLRAHLNHVDKAALITACICHDLDHPGMNNAYQVNARTDLAVRYQNVSPLENHHRDQSFKILSNPDTNIFAQCSDTQINAIKEDMSQLILATDMSRHNDYLKDFESKLSHFDFSDADHMLALKCILIKCCDVSNECRPIFVSEAWVEKLLEEYFKQSDLEKESGLPYASFMDRDSVTKSSSQVGFISFVLIPLFEALSKLLPEVETLMLSNLRQALEYYKSLERKEKGYGRQNDKGQHESK